VALHGGKVERGESLLPCDREDVGAFSNEHFRPGQITVVCGNVQTGPSAVVS
jgi:hypothetical protein